MTRRVRLHELLLGIQGLGIMRQLLRGSDENVQARVRDIADLVARLDSDPDLAAELTLPEMDAIEGYTSWATTYDEGGNPLIDLEEPVVREILRSLPPARAVDVACGTGRHTAFLLSLGHEVVGIDATAAMLERARDATGKNVYVQGDARCLPLADASADLVTCALALTHFERVSEPIEEFARVLREGGRVVLSDLHPLIRAIGGGAFFASEDGTFGLVREYLHLHSEYLAAFEGAGLKVVGCVEPVLTERQIEMFGFSYLRQPEAQRMSHLGLPFALIWHLIKA